MPKKREHEWWGFLLAAMLESEVKQQWILMGFVKKKVIKVSKQKNITYEDYLFGRTEELNLNYDT